MAFFGADGYEHQIRQMRIQLSSKGTFWTVRGDTVVYVS